MSKVRCRGTSGGGDPHGTEPHADTPTHTHMRTSILLRELRAAQVVYARWRASGVCRGAGRKGKGVRVNGLSHRAPGSRVPRGKRRERRQHPSTGRKASLAMTCWLPPPSLPTPSVSGAFQCKRRLWAKVLGKVMAKEGERKGKRERREGEVHMLADGTMSGQRRMRAQRGTKPAPPK